MTKPTPKDLDLFGLMPIHSQCPLDFGDGNQWDMIVGTCFKCRKQLLGVDFRGMVARKDERTFVLEATGACQTCRTVSVFDYQLHDNGRVTGVKDGIIAIWHSKPSRWDRLARAIGLKKTPTDVHDDGQSEN